MIYINNYLKDSQKNDFLYDKNINDIDNKMIGNINKDNISNGMNNKNICYKNQNMNYMNLMVINY